MKTKFKHILVILCLSMISCEGNLEPELFDQITPENFLTNEDDVKTAVTGVYVPRDIRMGTIQNLLGFGNDASRSPHRPMGCELVL